MPQKESDLQRKILKYLNSLPYCKAIKVISANERGVPDIHCSYKGRYIVFEVKTDTGRESGIQKAQRKEYETAAAIARVVRSLDEVKEIIETV